jgi:hypothetical protein
MIEPEKLIKQYNQNNLLDSIRKNVKCNAGLFWFIQSIIHKMIEQYTQNNLLDSIEKTRNIMQNICKNCGVKRRTIHYTNPCF